MEASLTASISGQEVATYWYSSIKRYDFFKRPSLLHTNVNCGHFTQIVWRNTKFVGVGKAYSNTGKIFVVGKLEIITEITNLIEINFLAFYYPPGNIIGEYHENVLPPVEERQQEQT